MRSYALFLASLLICISACKTKIENSRQDFLVNNIDTSINPADDFFRFTNGGWIKTNPIPAAESGWGIGNLVQEDIYLRLRTISEKAAKEAGTEGSVSQKIGDFWQSGMDSLKAEKQGWKPLQEILTTIYQITNAFFMKRSDH